MVSAAVVQTSDLLSLKRGNSLGDLRHLVILAECYAVCITAISYAFLSRTDFTTANTTADANTTASPPLTK